MIICVVRVAPADVRLMTSSVQLRRTALVRTSASRVSVVKRADLCGLVLLIVKQFLSRVLVTSPGSEKLSINLR